ncbi:type II secretion system F family protein, partial [Candidatus Micrarchaeota archaeon]|nr:type II secretion system F family protein [Candidatus Micrarchaeota archaeon]
MAFQSFFESFGRFFSRTQIRSFGRYLRAAGVETSPEAFAGYFLLNMVILTLLVIIVVLFDTSVYRSVNGFLLYAMPFLFKEVITVFVILISILFVYFTLFLLISSALVIMAEARKKAVEVVLPDFLLLVSANIKAGMALDQSLWYSAKPEFGLLSTEVKIVIKKAFSGESLDSALNELAERFDSKIFSRTVSLIKQASATGGEVAQVLERTSQDARNSSIMRKEIASSLIVYEIFVIFAAVVGTPFLFSVASKLIQVLEKAFSFIPASSSSASQFSFIRPVAPI